MTATLLTSQLPQAGLGLCTEKLPEPRLWLTNLHFSHPQKMRDEPSSDGHNSTSNLPCAAGGFTEGKTLFLPNPAFATMSCCTDVPALKDKCQINTYMGEKVLAPSLGTLWVAASSLAGQVKSAELGGLMEFPPRSRRAAGNKPSLWESPANAALCCDLFRGFNSIGEQVIAWIFFPFGALMASAIKVTGLA